MGKQHEEEADRVYELAKALLAVAQEKEGALILTVALPNEEQSLYQVRTILVTSTKPNPLPDFRVLMSQTGDAFVHPVGIAALIMNRHKPEIPSEPLLLEGETQ